MGDFKERLEQMWTHPGFIAVLDQSGGSAPHALRAYGIQDDAWSNEEQMFAIVHLPGQRQGRRPTQSRHHGRA
jgi:fructose-bisphosphate aldolase class I